MFSTNAEGTDVEGSAHLRWKHPFWVRTKKTCWDPISTATTLCLAVFAFTCVHSFSGHSLYQGGMAGAAEQWKASPVINMVWVPADQACAAGHMDLQSYDALFSPLSGARPVHKSQGKLCIERGGLPSDVPGDDVRPRANCVAEDGLKTCMEGKFPYCGKIDVPCPLVDVVDYTKHGNRTFSMRHTCNTSIPSAYLPWTGCRPIMDVLISSSHPCFKYSTNGWGVRQWGKRKRSAIGDSTKQCVRKDSRYRLMQVYPIVDAQGVKHDGPSTGIYYRHEIFYNPKCNEPQDKFDDGYLYVESLEFRATILVVCLVLLTIFVGVTSLFERHHKAQAIEMEFPGRRCEYSDVWIFIAILGRLAAVVLAIWCAANALGMRKYFSPLTIDQTCVDPLLLETILEFVKMQPRMALLMVMTAIILIIQMVLDVVITTPFERQESVPEAAPLFQPLPTESDSEKARRDRIKYVYTTRAKYDGKTVASKSFWRS